MQYQFTEENFKNIINLLKKIIITPSLSREENNTATIIEHFLKENNIHCERIINNVYAKNLFFDDSKPTILLNSHHDTVKPNENYTKDPFLAEEKDGKIFGLGSNDAGGALVALLGAFMHFFNSKNLAYNLIFLASAEEEISGKNGVELALSSLPEIKFGIVGEPTSMQMAIAEKGLLVIDAISKGVGGHAAREEGENAIYKAIKDIDWIRNYEFPKVSSTLGKVKSTVTMIKSGTQHNVIPDNCAFTIDVRVTDEYNLNEVLEIFKKNLSAELVPRSLRLNSSRIEKEHPIVLAANKLKIKLYGSPTLSDQALMQFPTVKIGPGDSERSHTSDEFIYVDQIKNGVETYIELLNSIV